ncbi:hypothetical protein L596_015903 [Steinernema carpocapsae]|uniref:7TM GPCR serpentine receptor class x (Srx) domain-containing protein n=1 Tax=Steinernema carpocapsae TaxID=34508 RepID=A0A4U5NHB7_STECR|nr:hypothetical protein L596_015903 [Steinernema carpocapsae]
MSALPSAFRYVDGVVYVLIAVLTLPVYVLVIKQFVTNKVFKSRSSFRIMAVLGIIDCFLQVGFFGCGIFTLCDSVFDATLEKIITSLVNASWNAAFPTIFLLALNRFAVISELKIISEKFHNFCLALVSLYWIAFFSICLAPWAGLIYRLDYGVGGYNFELPWNGTLNSFEYYVNVTCASLTLGLYILTVISLAHKRHQISSNQSVITQRELKILIQAVVIFLGSSANLLLSYYGTKLFTRSPLLCLIVMLILEVTFGIMNVTIYLVMNSELRSCFFTYKKISNVTVISSFDLQPNGIVSK